MCTLEQNYGSTQLIPSERSERAALATYGQLEDRLVALSGWLQQRGYRARPEDYIGESMFIHYAVAAGLGQLGVNGQLLTPQAGSRCRINVLTTDAPLEFDWPLDGRHYVPGKTPRVPLEIVQPPGYRFDPTRTRPPSTAPTPDLQAAADPGATGEIPLPH